MDDLSTFNAFKLPSMMIDNKPHWHDLAACRGAHDEDPSIFFPGVGYSSRTAKEYCNRCIVITECVEFADGKETLYPGVDLRSQIQKHGIWGGESWRQRNARLKREASKPKSTNRGGQPNVSAASKHTTHCKNGHKYVEGTVEVGRQSKSGNAYRKCLICLDEKRKRDYEVLKAKKAKKVDVEKLNEELLVKIAEMEERLKNE